MSELFRFVVSGTRITWFKQRQDGSFAQAHLQPNESLSFNHTTGQVTLTTRFANYLELEVYSRTPSLTDDPALYSARPVTRYTNLDGTPLDLRRHDLDGDGNVDDHVNGTGGDDHINGGFGDDQIHGGHGRDRLRGEDGNDRLFGGDGDDSLSGGSGNDLLDGGRGNDYANGGDGDDRIIGDTGDDVLAGDNGNDLIHGDGGNDHLDGGAGDDTLAGGSGNDVILGGHGNDTLQGADGNDNLSGGAGNDILYSSAGVDQLTGGLGADRFTFIAGGLSGTDHITDFSRAQHDVIDLSGIDANSGVAGNQAFTFIGHHAFSHIAGQLRVSGSGHATVLQGDINGDGVGDFAIRVDTAVSIGVADLIL